MDEKAATNLSIIGWREWVGLPDLGLKRIKAKVDSGARSSSLHATDVEEFVKNGVTYVRFKVHPFHRFPDKHVQAEAEVIEFRRVKSSSGKTTNRPVILTRMALLGEVWRSN